MSGEQFYINYSLSGEHYAMGPYHTRRFAMSHIDDVRRQPSKLTKGKARQFC
jgi:hypothetical protein